MSDTYELLTYADVAKRMNVSVRQVERFVARKTLPVVDLGHRTKRFRLADVTRMIARRAGDAANTY